MKQNKMIGNKARRIAAPLAAALAAVCVATTALPSYADSITVALVVDANGLETAFNLTLDVSATRYLCAAWAETDQGANYTAWTNDNFEVLGEVNAETTSWSFAAPKGWGAEMRALRFFLVEKETRPYDARVEWIESTGAEWINTGYVGGSEDHYWLHFAWLSGGTIPIGTIYSSNRYAPLHLDGLLLARLQQTGLGIIAKLLLGLVKLLAVGRSHEELYNIAASALACILNFNLHGIDAVLLLNFEIVVFEGGVAQAEAEGISHGLAERVEITIAYVDVLLIVGEIDVLLRLTILGGLILIVTPHEHGTQRLVVDISGEVLVCVGITIINLEGHGQLT